MDIQPLFVLIAGEDHLHGFTHTYAGALLIALLSAVSGKYLSEFALHGLGRDRFLPIRWRIACFSALIGCLSHMLLDSIMHTDVEPFAPFAAANPFLGALSLESLHKLCLYTGLLGIGLYFQTKTRTKSVPHIDRKPWGRNAGARQCTDYSSQSRNDAKLPAKLSRIVLTQQRRRPSTRDLPIGQSQTAPRHRLLGEALISRQQARQFRTWPRQHLHQHDK